jgi:predicted DNA-binding transcriptional regulator YafY
MGDAPLNLTLRVRGILSKYLAETPVAQDQVMTPFIDEWTQIKVSVPDTVQLRMWLRSMGPDAVVMSPSSLKEQLAAEQAELLKLYAE